MDKDLFEKREAARRLLAEHKENIKRLSETGVPLSNTDFELVSMCLHYILGDLAIAKLEEDERAIIDDIKRVVAQDQNAAQQNKADAHQDYEEYPVHGRTYMRYDYGDGTFR